MNGRLLNRGFPPTLSSILVAPPLTPTPLSLTLIPHPAVLTPHPSPLAITLAVTHCPSPHPNTTPSPSAPPFGHTFGQAEPLVFMLHVPTWASVMALHADLIEEKRVEASLDSILQVTACNRM